MLARNAKCHAAPPVRPRLEPDHQSDTECDDCQVDLGAHLRRTGTSQLEEHLSAGLRMAGIPEK